MIRLRTGVAVIVIAFSLARQADAAPPAAASDAALTARVIRVLKATPLIDGHNDLPWEIRARTQDHPDRLDLAGSLSAVGGNDDDGTPLLPLMTDLPRLRAGMVGGQFWSVWIPADITGDAAVQRTIEQIDIVRTMAERYPASLELATTADDVRRIHHAGRIACLIGIEGGHQIGNSMAALRQTFALGARYMTLTHSRNNDWADSATDKPIHHGLTAFGRAVVGEMNRLGMLVDLSHVSPETMAAVLDVTKAPVIFSHSGARALVDHPRNVPDEILLRVARNHGVVMVNFYPGYVSAARARWEADRVAETTRLNAPPFAGLFIGQPDKAKAAMEDWLAAHPAPRVTIAMVADHIDHIRRVAGIDSVGLGSDFDGVDAVPEGLDGPDKFPILLSELAHRGWTDDDLAKLAGGNILRVMAAAESAARELRRSQRPSFATVTELDKPAR